MSDITITQITDTREFTIRRLNGSIDWRISEFDSGNVLLIVTAAGIHLSAHFTGEQWAEFQKLVAGRP